MLSNYNINYIEGNENKHHFDARMQALKKVNELAKKLIKEDEGKIRRFLSYRLGVYGADIDALCVAPHQVDQANYFIASFVDLLKQQPEVAELGVSY